MQKEVEYLTARQREVVALVAEGYSEKEIADRLSVTEKTINGIKARVRTTLQEHFGLSSIVGTAEMTHYAIARGLTKLRFTEEIPPTNGSKKGIALKQQNRVSV